MNIRYIFACVLLFILSQTQAYGQFVIQKVDSLRENACAIVDNYSAVFSQTDLNNATLSVSKVITILNEQGEEYGYFNETYDKFRELKDAHFEACILSNFYSISCILNFVLL